MGLARFHKATIDLETVYGTGNGAPTPIPLFGDALPKPKYSLIEAEIQRGMGRSPAYIQSVTNSIAAKFRLKGSGTAGTACELDKLIQIAGFSSTDNGTTSEIYSPLNSAWPSATVTINLDGIDWALKGCRIASLKIPLKAGELCVCEADIQGLWVAPSAAAYSAPTFTNAAVVPAVVQSLAITINSQTHVISEITFDLVNEMLAVPDVNAANYGVSEIAIVGRNWGGTMKVKRDDNNDLEWLTDLFASSEVAVASTGFGPAGNRMQFSTSSFQIVDLQPVNVNGMWFWDATFRINVNATPASEFSLTML